MMLWILIKRKSFSLILLNCARAFVLDGFRRDVMSSVSQRTQSAISMPLMLGESTLKRDVVVIGGGLAGLSTALELAKRGRHVTVLRRNKNEAASNAAGGMIAPQSERLESSAYLNLCLASRDMYSDWIKSVENLAGLGINKEKSRPDTGFWSAGGFLAPAFEGDAVHMWKPPKEGGQSHWLNKVSLLNMEPSISDKAVGGWWYPQDMNVDAQALYHVLEQAAISSGVHVLEGYSANGIIFDQSGSKITAIVLNDGRHISCEVVIGATGAWMTELLPVPMTAHKGQMMALRAPSGYEKYSSIPKRVLFAEDAYIIPKRDGRIVIGATVEKNVWSQYTTPKGVAQLINSATKICPDLAEFEICRTWAGLRPVTPDTYPILGPFQKVSNLFVAGGYWRNGVLLAPKTAQLLADSIGGTLNSADAEILGNFSVERFLDSDSFQEKSPISIASSKGISSKTRQNVAEDITADQSDFSILNSGTDAAELAAFEQAVLDADLDKSYFDQLGDLSVTGTELIKSSSPEFSSFDGISEIGTEPFVDDSSTIESNLPLALNGYKHDNTMSKSVPNRGELGADGSVTDYDALPEFNEQALKDARESNRNIDQIFQDFEYYDPQENSENTEEISLYSWEISEEQAKSLGIELREVEISPEDFEKLKNFKENSDDLEFLKLSTVILQREEAEGGPITIPFGKNVQDLSRDIPRNIADFSLEKESAARGKEERRPEISELYRKIIENKKNAEISHAEPANISERVEIGQLSKEEDFKEASFDAYEAIMKDRHQDNGSSNISRASNRLDSDEEWSAFEEAFNEYSSS